MPLDPAAILAIPPAEVAQTLTPRDVILYALGVGATELPFVYEAGLRMLPTMMTTLGHSDVLWRENAFNLDLARIVHAECHLEISAPLPTSGEIITCTTWGPIFDKGAEKGAIIHQTRALRDAAGQALATVRNAIFARGDGGFGGSAAREPAAHTPPDRPSDAILPLPIAPDRAMIYRLSGDLNPLHIDPRAARRAGFPQPILHGLCTMGMVCHTLLNALCDGDPARLLRTGVRFSAPCYPGETLAIELWKVGDTEAAFRAIAPDRGKTVLGNGYFVFG